MAKLIGELQEIISIENDKIVNSSIKDKPKALNALWEKTCEQLNSLGHGLYRHDYNGDIRVEHHSQVWGQNYMEDIQNGLNIIFESHAITVSWIIHNKKKG